MMKANAICAKCPVRRECLAFALRTDQVHGMWGGMSEQERRALRSAVKAAERGQATTAATVHVVPHKPARPLEQDSPDGSCRERWRGPS